MSTSNFFRPLQDMPDVEPDNQEENGDDSVVIDGNDIVVSSYLAKAKLCAQVMCIYCCSCGGEAGHGTGGGPQTGDAC